MLAAEICKWRRAPRARSVRLALWAATLLSIAAAFAVATGANAPAGAAAAGSGSSQNGRARPAAASPKQSATATPMGPYPEAVVEAVFLYRIAGYVQWPAGASGETGPERAAPARRFTIAVIGADQVAIQLRQLLPGLRIHGEPATVRRIPDLRDLDGAQMLYIGPQYHGDLAALTRTVAGRPILVVTDHPGALAEGSMLNFMLVAQHLRFEVSLVAARRSGLKISSALLAVAMSVKTGRRDLAVCPPFGPRPAHCLSQLARVVPG